MCSKEKSNKCKEILEKRNVLLKSNMQSVKAAMDMWSNRPAAPIQYKKSKIVPKEDDKNCHSTKYNKAVCVDKKCQATKCYKKVDKL